MKNKKEKKIQVIFRVDKNTGEVIAVFPTLCYQDELRWDEVWSYTHNGQHAEINRGHYTACTTPATKGQYIPLLMELHAQGYRHLDVRKRWVRTHY